MANIFKLNHFLVILLPLFFIACSPDGTRLPDDPDNEPIIQPVPGREGSEELPSKGEDVILPEIGTPDTGAPAVPKDEQAAVLAKYDYVDPTRIVPTKALEQALLYYDQNKATLKNSKVLSIIDFSQSSKKKRWYFINMATGSVWNIHVSHGKGSDSNHDGFAEKFSNVSGSNATSLGFYKTAETYSGKWGYSLRLDGLSTTNAIARPRAIVVHGASYVQDKEVIQGRSWGCPAVSLANSKAVIDLIRGGSIIYAVN